MQDDGPQPLLPMLSRFTVLQVLEFHCVGTDHVPHQVESEQRDLVRAVSNVCPSVREILFEPREPIGGVGTTREWRKSLLGHWEVYTVYHYRED